MFSVRVQQEKFNLDQEEKKLRQDKDCGAMVLFQGIVREYDDETTKLKYLYIEHFPVVTEKEIERVIKKVYERWDLRDCIVIHRVGQLVVGEPIVLVAVTSKHRKSAFQAAEFLMDFLKMEAPFWKKEFFCDGRERWVAVKKSDVEAQQRWWK